MKKMNVDYPVILQYISKGVLSSVSVHVTVSTVSGALRVIPACTGPIQCIAGHNPVHAGNSFKKYVRNIYVRHMVSLTTPNFMNEYPACTGS